MNPQPPNPRSVFGRAAELDSATERQAYLDEACAGAPHVRERVEVLLRAHEAAGGFLQPAAAGPADTASYAPSPEAPNTVGPYKLLEKIGEGGMGEVWVADQMEPIKRRVALKLIKPGMDSRGVLARFEAERQALAVMDHPNIAKVLDAGTTPDGRPYFVMELVKGTPITEFCDVRKLTPKERLELFVPVCQAIQHAHMKGIIHRDIKPSNVLVELYDDKAVAKVIDFGVAKAIGQRLTDKTIYTGFGALVGTPAYMAPEQATFNALDVDTRADVYALGVLLYELLAGSPPIEKERLNKAALEEVLRIVRDEEPVRPSQRLSTSQTKASIAATRQSEPGALSQMMKGELDWIVMKALEKDRTRRYDTATALAKDVQRYLTGDSVEACPPTLGYRLKKAYRRNRTAVRVASAFACLLLAGVAVSSALAVQASRAERDAEARRQEAVENAGRADENARTAQSNEERAQREAANVRAEQDRTRRLLYASHISHASMALAEGRGGQLIRQLDEASPRPGEPDLRNWEWHFLDRQTRPDREFKVDTSGRPKTDASFRQIASVSGDALASRNGRWIVSCRAVGEGYVFDVREAATGRHLGQVPKTDVLKHEPEGGLMLQPLLSEDGRHLLVTKTRLQTRRDEGSEAPLEQPRMWEVASGREVGALPNSMQVVSGARHLIAVVGGGDAAWVAWLEPTTPKPSSRVYVKGPVKYSVARWEAATGKVTRKEVAVGTGWGMARLGSDGRSVFWYPVSERLEGMVISGGSGSDPIEYGEFQRWDVENPLKVQAQVRVPVSDGRAAFVAMSASWDMLAVLDRRQVTVYSLSDGRVHWQAPVPAAFDTSDSRPMSGPRQGFVVSDDGNRVVFNTPETVYVVEKGTSGKPSERRFGYRSILDANGLFNVVRDFWLLPDGRTLVRQDHDTVRVWDVTRGATGLKPPTGGGRKLVTDPEGRAWFVLSTADGRRTVKWSPPPGRDDGPADKNAPRHLFLLDGDGKELGKLDLGPTRSTEANWLSGAIMFVDSDRRLLLNTIRPKDARPGLTYLSPPPAPNTPGITEWTSEWALYDLVKPGFERVASGGGNLYPVPNSPYLAGNGPRASILDEPSSFAVYDARTGRTVSEYRPPPSARFLTLGVSRLIDPAARRVVMATTTGSKDDTAGAVRIEVCEIATGKPVWAAELADVQFHKSATARSSFQIGARFTPDGSRVVVDYRATDGWRLGVWSAATGTHERTLSLTSVPDGTPRISDFALAPDGRYLALSLTLTRLPVNTPEFLDVWNLDTGVRVQRLTGFGEGFGQIALSTDGMRLFATDRTPPPGTPGRLHIWDVATGRELLTLPIDYGPNPLRNVLKSLRFDAGKLHIVHPDWEQTLDGTPLPEPKR